MPSFCISARLAAGLLAAGIALQAAVAQTPAAADPTLKETAVAVSAFVRSAPLPAWADVLALADAPAARRSLAVRFEDTHLLVADRPVQLLNLAQQANDANALALIGQITLHFVPQYQRLLLHRVAILRGGRLIDHTPSVPVRFLQREAGLEKGIYSGVVTASLLLPDVRVGDTLHLQYSIEGANPIFGGRYVHAASWQRPVPVQWRRVTLHAPRQREVRWKWVGDGAPSTLGPALTSNNGLQHMRFEERDVAEVEAEPMLPRGAYPMRWLQFSEFADWADVARWADALFPGDAVLPTELLPLTHRLLRIKSPAEQASVALQWVQSEIRYVSVSLGESSHRPHTPAEVLRNRYGDCKDKSFLLMRILQSVGIPARAVLASLGAPQGPGKQLASPLAFDHAVVHARIDGRDYFLDPTRMGQRGPLDRMGQGLEESSVLVVDARETQGLAIVRSPNRRDIFRSELSEKFVVAAFSEANPQGDAARRPPFGGAGEPAGIATPTQAGELQMQQTWVGTGAEAMRLTAARLDPARLQRSVLAGVEPRYPGATLIGVPELTDEVERNRITLSARFHLPSLLTAVDGLWLLRYTPANMQGTLAIPPSATRSQALALPAFPVSVSYSAEVQWPAGVVGMADPVTQRFDNAQFRAEVTRSFRGSVARVTLDFEALTPSVAASDVPAFLDDARKLDRTASGVLRVPRNLAGAAGGTAPPARSLRDELLARAQLTIDRSGKAVASGQLGGDDLAQALCLRAQAHAETGAMAQAMQDAGEALRLAPSLASASMCRGHVNWARGEFAAAAADFGKALALGHPAAEAYLRRGHARFYEGRLEQAADDFAKAAADRSLPGNQISPLLWQGWALQRLGRALPSAAAGASDAASVWPRPALALLAGQVSPEQLLEQIARKSGNERELALAEAWFYIGQFHLSQAQPDKARSAFEAARAQGIVNYVEHIAAGFELQRLGAKP